MRPRAPIAETISARVLEVENLNTLAALRIDGIRRYPNAFLLTEAEARASDARLVDWLTSGNAVGVFANKTLIGFAGLRGMQVSMAGHRTHLGPFYVAPDRHGTGAADRLLAHVFELARARGAAQLELYVAADNKRARSFYAKNGFKVVGNVPSAVILDDIPRDDFFMVRDLTIPVPQPGPDGLRRLGPGDWRAFRTIRLQMLEEAPEFFGSSLTEWAEKAPDEIMDLLEKIHLWAEVRDGRVLATAGWSAISGKVLEHRASVISVFTTSDARGRGLSARVLSALEEDARSNGIVQLELSVGANNPGAEAAYLAAGYQRVGTTPRALNYSGRFVDQHEMVKALAG